MNFLRNLSLLLLIFYAHPLDGYAAEENMAKQCQEINVTGVLNFTNVYCIFIGGNTQRNKDFLDRVQQKMLALQQMGVSIPQQLQILFSASVGNDIRLRVKNLLAAQKQVTLNRDHIKNIQTVLSNIDDESILANLDQVEQYHREILQELYKITKQDLTFHLWSKFPPDQPDQENKAFNLLNVSFYCYGRDRRPPLNNAQQPIFVGNSTVAACASWKGVLKKRPGRPEAEYLVRRWYNLGHVELIAENWTSDQAASHCYKEVSPPVTNLLGGACYIEFDFDIDFAVSHGRLTDKDAVFGHHISRKLRMVGASVILSDRYAVTANSTNFREVYRDDEITIYQIDVGEHLDALLRK